jgi:hypothetical protein
MVNKAECIKAESMKVVPIRFCTILLLATFLSSCSEDLGKDKTAKVVPPEVVQPLSEELIGYELIPQDNPNEYLVRFNWPRLNPSVMQLKLRELEH